MSPEVVAMRYVALGAVAWAGSLGPCCGLRIEAAACDAGMACHGCVLYVWVGGTTAKIGGKKGSVQLLLQLVVLQRTWNL